MNFKLTIKCLMVSGIMGFYSQISAQEASTASAPTASTSTVATTSPEETTEEKKDVPLSISGQVDAYFRYSSAKSAGLTSYTPGINSFGLGMANIVASKDLGKVSFTADLMFGPRAEATNYYYGTNSMSFIKQLFVSYKPTDKVKFTFGNFMTFVGYELVEASNNLNYSMSYNYTNGPFFHTGLKADFALTDKLSLMVGVFEPTDTKFYNGEKSKLNVGGQLAYVNGGFKIYVNAITGKSHSPFALNPAGVDTTTSGVAVLDVTTSYQVTPKFGLGLNIINKSAKLSDTPKAARDAFTGYAAYANYAVSDKFTIAARGEYFDDSKGVALLKSKITAFTLSGNVKIDALTIIPELRFDSAKDAIFNGKKSDLALIMAAVYKF
jgi:hypothetical protein